MKKKIVNPLRPSDPISLENQAKYDVETIENLNKPKEQKKPDTSPCGIDKPCVFGKFNKNFNKKSISNY